MRRSIIEKSYQPDESISRVISNEKPVLANWIAKQNTASLKRLFRSQTFITNFAVSLISGLIGHLIGGLDLAMLMVFLTTVCDEWIDLIKSRPYQNQGIISGTFGDKYQDEPVYEKEASVLFADIRNFTGLTASMSGQASFRLIRDYMNVMLPIIIKNRGIVNQVMGDGILAVFHDSADNSVEAAIEIQEALVAFNKRHHLDLEVGIGIATGPVIAGRLNDVASDQLFVTSHTVNIASRIECLTKQMISNVLVCAETIKQTSFIFRHDARSLGNYTLKGSPESTEIFSIRQIEQKKSKVNSRENTLRVA
jgi:class 3 adenylate cyclase